ncbi:hypothetical protein AAG570_011423 [Ranatra chinensis]|uniref:Uncharacterized protein n=1 Tax=Ranatra chinensis TaxID=642074 RepID=A0ABD0YKW0_9HEMI
MEELEEMDRVDVEEEDLEVAVRGTELSRYLQANFRGLVEWGEDSGRGSPALCLHQDQTVPTSVQPWMLEAVEKVLHCDLLLDEDASYLYEVTSQVGAIGVICGPCEVLEFLVSRCHWAAGLLVLGDGFRRLVTHRRTKLMLTAIDDLCKRLRVTHRLVRKTLQRLREQQAAVISKEAVARLAGRNLKKLPDDSASTHALTECLISMISASRRLTIGLISIAPLPEDFTSVDLYLAHRNLPMPCTEDLPALERLKNIYLLLQSESLRRLGLAFCRPLSGSEPVRIFQEVYCYSTTTREISARLNRAYESHFLSKTPDHVPSKTPILVDGYSAVHRFTRSLNSVLVEARLIEESLTGDVQGIDILQWLENTEKEFNNTAELLGQAKKYFLRLKNGAPSDDTPPQILPQPAETSKNEIRIPVGHSDFEPKGGDSIYLGVVTSGIDQPSQDDAAEGGYETATLPRYVLSELEGALENKRIEFESRELEAAKKNPEYESYLKFEEQKDDGDTKRNSTGVNEGSTFCGGFDLLRTVIAESGKNLSAHQQEEEVYGSGSESEC